MAGPHAPPQLVGSMNEFRLNRPMYFRDKLSQQKKGSARGYPVTRYYSNGLWHPKHQGRQPTAEIGSQARYHLVNVKGAGAHIPEEAEADNKFLLELARPGPGVGYAT